MANSSAMPSGHEYQILSLKACRRQEAPISVANWLADNSLGYKFLFADSFVLYVNDRFAVAGLRYSVREEEASGKNANRDADSYTRVIRLHLVHWEPPEVCIAKLW